MPTEQDVRDRFMSRLPALLPQLELEEVTTDGQLQGRHADLVLRVRFGRVAKTLAVEVRSSGQPRYLQQAIGQLQRDDALSASTYPVIAAPYISPRGIAICRQHQVGCVDLMGNVYLAFDKVYIERTVEEKPEREKRRIKNLFAPVSSRIIRAMLEEPDRAWTLTELAESSNASLGQVYKVSEKLVDEALARKSRRDGLALIEPAGLLELWRNTYDVQATNETNSFHASERNPRRLMDQIARAAADLGEAYAFTIHAGASLVAPHVRFSDVHFYIQGDLQAWSQALDLHTVEFGGNVHLLQPYDEGVFYRPQRRDGITVVCNIQLYLDLYHYPARGREQAEFLRDQVIGF